MCRNRRIRYSYRLVWNSHVMAIPNMEILRVASMRIGPLSVGVGRRLYCSQVYGLLLFCSHIFAVRRNYSHTVLLSTGLVKEIWKFGTGV